MYYQTITREANRQNNTKQNTNKMRRLAARSRPVCSTLSAK